MISIISGIYNHRRQVYLMYYSLTNQTFKDFEWIVCDDGSTDDTVERVKNMQRAGHLPIKLYTQENKGMRYAKCVNEGMKMAEGDLLFMVTGDSYLDNNTLEELDKAYKPGTAGSGIRKNVDDNMRFLKLDWRVKDPRILNSVFEIKRPEPWSYLCGNAMIVEKYALEHIGGYPEDYVGYGLDDYAAFMRLHRSGIKLYMYNNVYVNHVYHGEGRPDDPESMKKYIKEMREGM